MAAAAPAAKAIMGNKFLGLGLTGLSLGLPVVDALNANREDPTRDPGANLAGGVGAVAGGLAGAGAARFIPGNRLRNQAMRFAAVPIGAMVGGGLGGSLASGAYSGVRGLFKDPMSDYIAQTEALGASQARQEAARMRTMMGPMYEAGLAQNALMAKEDMRRAQLMALLNYQQGILGASSMPGGTYADPAFSQSLASIASGALG
jgi:hypothetical protein